MARQPKPIENEEPATEPVTETITYLPGPHDPNVTTWCGITFHANVPKDVTGHAEGSEREKLHHHLIERARDNPFFKVGNARPKKPANELPKTAEQYRAYVVGWLSNPDIQHANDLIARWARDRDLRAACEVGADDYSYLGTLFMPKLHELARGDELTEQQVAVLWVENGITELPW